MPLVFTEAIISKREILTQVVIVIFIFELYWRVRRQRLLF